METWKFIEHEGVVYRGPSRAVPLEIWNGVEFVAYAGAGISRGVD